MSITTWRALGLSSAIALVTGCGLSVSYDHLATGGEGAGNAGGGSVGGAGANGSTSAGSAAGGHGTSAGAGVTGAGAGATGTGNGGFGTSNGAGAGTSGGTSGGSNGCAQEFDTCNPSVGCICNPGNGCGCPAQPLSCVYEPLKNGYACEVNCSQTLNCPTAYTVCTGTSCTLNICGIGIGGPPNGTIDGTCNAEGNQDGTCFPVSSDGGEPIGICYQGGDATSGQCVLGAPRTMLQALCPAGTFCAPSITSPGNTCYELCNPEPGEGGNEKCGDAGFDNGCSLLSQNPPIGACF